MTTLSSDTANESLLKTALAFLFILACTLGVAYFFGPGLVHDIQLRGRLVPAENVRSVSAWCKPQKVIVSSCDIEIELEDRPGRIEFDYLMPPGLLGKQTVTVLRSSTNPERLSTSLGQDYLFGRLIVFVLLIGSLVGALALGIWARVAKSRPARLKIDKAMPRETFARPVRAMPRSVSPVGDARASFGRR